MRTFIAYLKYIIEVKKFLPLNMQFYFRVNEGGCQTVKQYDCHSFGNIEGKKHIIIIADDG
jgi:hypothetical protein